MLRLDHYWYHCNTLATLLRPLSWCFRGLISLRKLLYRSGVLKSIRLPVPVIVVGNISVGGTGKTPLVIALIALLKKHGYTPGIITRGYGGNVDKEPLMVTANSDPFKLSDEAVLLAQRTQCLVVACPDRIASSQLLIEQGCNIIVSDDGLQYYRLERDIEIAVIDASRGLGNGYCLPAGPLREPEQRLKTVDFVVINGLGTYNKGSNNSDHYNMTMHSHAPRCLINNEEKPIGHFTGTSIHAIAAIGNPQRFYNYLRSLGLTVIEHHFSDHYRYQTEDIVFDDEYPVLMTEKDAVKCREIIKDEKYYYIAIDAILDGRLEPSLMSLLKTVTAQDTASNR
ncbi:MAG: tetraacyldisaccharide 4'-kinase [Gammaproteobacteria bacterium]|nr:tetraacyldisaccharide 4'-kinase [Gammaproteobacteria bacterium]